MAHSPRYGYAVRERDSGRLGFDKLYSKGTRVSRLTYPLNALLTSRNTAAKTMTRRKRYSRLVHRALRLVDRSRLNLCVSP